MKNIIFDLGGVILKEEPISVLNELDLNKETYNELKRFFNNWDNLDLGKDTLLDIYNRCNYPKEYEILYKDKLINYYKYRKIDMRLIDCINKLKNNNYSIYILSDNNQECFDYYKNNNLFKNIDGWIISCTYHTVKKDGLLFDILINKYNLKKDECYFIDNNKEVIKVLNNNINNLKINNSSKVLLSSFLPAPICGASI